MLVYFFMLVVAAVGIAGNFSLTKVYQRTMGTALKESVIFNMLVGLFGTAFFFVLNGFHFEWTPFSLLFAFLQSLLVGVYTMIGFKIMSMGSMTVYTIFLMLGGAVVPYVYGVLFLHETVNAVKIIALLLIVVSVVLNSGGGKEGRQSVSFLLLCILVFFINGATSVLAKVHQIEKVYPVVSADAFVLLKNSTRFLFFALLLPFCRSKNQVGKTMPKKMHVIMLGSAVVSGFSYVLQLIGAANMPATMVYPIITGGSVVFTSLFDRFCFGQKLHKKTIISIFICMVALILFVIE